MANQEKTIFWSMLPIDYFQDQKVMLNVPVQYLLPHFRSVGDDQMVAFLEYLLLEGLSMYDWSEQSGEDDEAFKRLKRIIAITPGMIDYAHHIGFVPKASRKSDDQPRLFDK